MTRLWVYKCNARNQPHQTAYGDWSEFFADPGDGEWGGTWATANPASRRIVSERMKTGDLVLAYQTDLRAAIGLCRVVRLVDEDDGETRLYLEPIERFPEPVDILSLKKRDPEVAAIRAFQQGRVQTLYETTEEEAATLLRVCGVRTATSPSDSDDAAAASGAGFGIPASNRQVERAAVAIVTDYYESRGWRVRSVEDEHIGYDLNCLRHGQEHHVEVKGVSGSTLAFLMTTGELERAKSDSDFYLAIVTRALSEPRISIWSGNELLDQFEQHPVQFLLRYRASHCRDSSNLSEE